MDIVAFQTLLPSLKVHLQQIPYDLGELDYFEEIQIQGMAAISSELNFWIEVKQYQIWNEMWTRRRINLKCYEFYVFHHKNVG